MKKLGFNSLNLMETDVDRKVLVTAARFICCVAIDVDVNIVSSAIYIGR